MDAHLKYAIQYFALLIDDLNHKLQNVDTQRIAALENQLAKLEAKVERRRFKNRVKSLFRKIKSLLGITQQNKDESPEIKKDNPV